MSVACALPGSDDLAPFYCAERETRSGSNATVWRVMDLLGRKCALKIALGDDKRWHDGVLREAKAQDMVRHRGVPRVFTVGTYDGKPAMVSEWVEGETLKSAIQDREIDFPIAYVLDVIASAASVLKAVHRAGVVHRDIKPANLIVNGTDVSVIDFGLALLPDGSGASVENELKRAGTPLYLAPEVEPSPAVDVYSLGCCAYELLTGRPPFPGEFAKAVITRHEQEAVLPPSELRRDVPPSVDRLLLKALAKRPADRYLNAAAFEHEARWVRDFMTGGRRVS